MALECPKCKSPVSRDGQKFCYRCGNDLSSYYAALQINVTDPGSDSGSIGVRTGETVAVSSGAPAPPMPQTTRAFGSEKMDITSDTVVPPSAAAPQRATLRVLLPTGDVFDRELVQTETQIGKGPRNDIVITDPAVSSAHAVIRAEEDHFVLSDLGSRNGTFINGVRLTTPRRLEHGDVVGIGLSKLTFRMAGASDTTIISVGAGPPPTAPQPPPLTEEGLRDAVVAAGLVAAPDLEAALVKRGGRRLYQVVTDGKLVSEESLRDLIGGTFRISTIDLKSWSPDSATAVKLSAGVARAHLMIPVGIEGEKIILAVADPTNREAIEKVRQELGRDVTLRVATSSQIMEQIDLLYGPRIIAVLPNGERLEYFISQPEVEIGKAAHNAVVLSDPTVSNAHAILLARDGGYSIVDLGSRNGTFVNGERLGTQALTLRHGDTIQMGQSLITFRNRAETAANTTATLDAGALAEIRRRAEQMDTSAEKEMDAASVLTPAALAQRSISTPPPFAAPLQPEAGGNGAAADAAAPGKGAGDEKSGKKKKKKKKGGTDERLKAAYIGGLSRILAQVFAVVLSVGLALYITQRQMTGEKPKLETGKKGKAKLKLKETGATAFTGGPYEASGAIAVPGTEGMLIVDDGRPGEVLWMQVDGAGHQVGEIKPVQLGVTVIDPESITTDGSHFYIMGSQSDLDAGQKGGLARFTFDASTQTVTKAEVITGMREFLVENVPELKGMGDTKASEGGMNIEGIAWDPDPERNRLLLGFRSPQVDSNALIVPLKIKNPGGPFTLENLQVGKSIELALGGLGIRDIQYDSRLKNFLIISGAPEHHEKTTFTLWEWNGDADQSKPEAVPREEMSLNSKMKPEGVTRVKAGGNEFIFIVGDASSYTKYDYSEEQ